MKSKSVLHLFIALLLCLQLTASAVLAATPPPAVQKPPVTQQTPRAIVALKPLAVTITSPAAGQDVLNSPAPAFVVKWTYTGAEEQVRVVLLVNGAPDHTLSVLSVGTGGQGQLSWAPPAGELKGCQIRIEAVSDSRVLATSPVFTVRAPSIKIQPFWDASNWVASGPKYISWTFEPQPGTVKVELAGQVVYSPTEVSSYYEWKVIATDVPIGANGTGGLTVTLPGGKYSHYIRITNEAYPSITYTTAVFYSGQVNKGTPKDKTPPE